MEQLKIVKKEVTGLELAKGIMQSSINIARIEMKITISENLKKPLIRSVFKGDNSEFGFTFVTALVKRFIDSFGFSTKMNESQIEMLVVDTLEKFQYESVEDLILFFKMARSGSFGTTMRGVDSNLIFGEWFPMYMELKSDAREKHHDEEKSKFNIEQRGTDDEAYQRWKEMKEEKGFEKKVKDFVDSITENMDRQMLEDTITDWEKDPERKPYVDLLKRKRRARL